MSVDLLNQRREKKSRGSSLESRVSALENYIAMLIGTNEIMDGAITTPKLLDGCVSELKIAADAVTNAKIAVDAIQGDVIAAGAITENKLYNGAVTADKIATNAVTTAKIEAGAITAGEIATGAVTATKIYAGAVTADKIATNAVTADKINVSQLSAISANIGSVTAGTITSATVRTNAATHPYAKMDSGGFEVNGRYMTFNKDDGTGIGEVYGSGTYGLMISSFSGKQCYVNGANNLILNAGEGTLQLRHGNDTRAYTSSDSLIISSGLTLGGVRRTSWPSASSGANTALSNLTTTSINKSLLPSSGDKDLGDEEHKWRYLYVNSTSYIGGTLYMGGNVLPNSANSRYCGSLSKYWKYVYSYYLKYKVAPSSFDAYDDLQILRDLKTSGNKIDMRSMPKGIYDKNGFTSLGDLNGFNLCASKKIVEYVDDLKEKIDNLTNRLSKLERKKI